MKIFKRWLALILAVTLVATNAIYSMGSSLKANVAEEQGATTEAPPIEQEPDTSAVGDDLGVTVVDAGNGQAQDVPPAEPAAEPITEPTPQSGETVDPEAAVSQLHNVTIMEPGVGGGSILAWSAEEEQAEVTYAEGKFVKEITEGTPFYFEVTAPDNHQIAQVADQNGAIQKTEGDENRARYEIQNVTEAKEISITYQAIDTANEIGEIQTPPAAANGSLLGMEQEADSYFKVTFVDKDGKEIATQEVEAGKAAVAPVYPEVEGYKFTGWDKSFTAISENMTVQAQYAELKNFTITLEFVLGTVTTDAKETGIIRVASPYVASVEEGKPFQVSVPIPDVPGFTVRDGQEQVAEGQFTFNIASVTADVTETVAYTGEEMTYQVKHLQEQLTGSYEVKDTDTLDGATGVLTEAEARNYSGFTPEPFANLKVASDGSTAIEIKYRRNSNLVLYDTTGGSYVKPETVKFEAGIPVPAEAEIPTKLGYTFLGWQMADGTPVTADTKMPDDNITLNAQWQENATAGYTIVAWKQQAEGNQYDFGDIITGKTGKVGEAIAVDTNALFGKGTYENVYYDYFQGSIKDEPVVITADGKAVKNVYFDRKIFKIEFEQAQLTEIESKWVGQPSKYKLNTVSHKECNTITARYGADIGAIWNKKPYSNYKWATTFNPVTSEKVGSDVFTEADGKIVYINGWGPGKTWYTQMQKMPASFDQPSVWDPGHKGDTFQVYADDMQTGKSLIYYEEDLEGEYKEARRYSVSKDSMLTGEDKQARDGFSFYEASHKIAEPDDKDNPSKPNVGNLWLKFSRNSYPITFMNGTVKYDETLIKFEKTIAGAQPAAPTIRPAGVDSDYVFAGWNLSPTGEKETAVDWDSTMPSHSLIFYANWVAPEKTVTFDTNDGGTIAPIKVIKYESLDGKMPENPIKADGSEFAGWYRDKELKEPFVATQLITADITLFAKWVKANEVSYTIVCQDEDGNSIADVIKETAGKDTTATVDAPGVSGYIPTVASKSVTFNQDKMQVIFTYTKSKTWDYTVKYIDKTTNKEIATETKGSTGYAMLTIKYQAIDGYVLAAGEAYQQTVTKEKHAITFSYLQREAGYTVKHHVEQMDGSDKVAEEESLKAMVGTTVTATPKVYENRTCVTTGRSLTGIVQQDGSMVIDLYYKYNKSNYQVEYYLQNNDGTYPETVDESKKVKKRAVVGATVSSDTDAKTFEGYVYNSNNTSNVKTAENAADGTTVLKRYYKLQLSVTYDNNGGTGSVTDQTAYDYNAAVTAKGKGNLTYDKADIIFVGWTKEQIEKPLPDPLPEGTTEPALVTEFNITENTTLYALWAEDKNGNGKPDYKDDHFTITFQAGANGQITGTNTFANILTGTAFGKAVNNVPEPKANTGYHFDKWVAADNVEGLPGKDAKITADAAYTALFAINTYEIKVKVNNGSLTDSANAGKTNATFTKDYQTNLALTYQADANYRFQNVVVKIGGIETTYTNSAFAAAYSHNAITSDAEITINYERDYSGIAATPYDAEYDGKPHSITVTGFIDEENGENGETLRYKVTDGGKTETVSTLARTNVCDLQVTVEVVKGEKVVHTADSVILRITKRPITITAQAGTMVYGTTMPTLLASITSDKKDIGGELGAISGVLDPEKGPYVPVGLYENAILPKTTNTEKEKNYEITRQPANFTITQPSTEGMTITPEGKAWTYNGETYAVVPGLSEEAVAAGYVPQYRSVDSTGQSTGEWTTEAPSLRNVADGPKKVEVRAVVMVNGVPDTNHKELLAENPVTLTVTAKPVTFTVGDDSKVFGTDDQPERWSGTFAEGDVEKNDTMSTPTYSRRNAEENRLPNTYPGVLTALFTRDADPNYAITVVNGTFTITEAELPDAKLTVENLEKTYDATPLYAAAALEAAEQYELRWSKDGVEWSTKKPNVTEVQPGNIATTVYVKAVREGYQELAPQTFTLKILPKDITITAANATKEFGVRDEEVAFTGTVTEDKLGLIKAGDLGTITYARLVSGTPETEALGTYNDITPTYTNQNINYQVATATGTLTITPKVVADADFTIQGGTQEYNGNPYTLETYTLNEKAQAAGYQLVYATEADAAAEAWSATLPTVTTVDEGEVTVYAKAIRENYQDLKVKTATIQITPRETKITVDPENKFFGKEDPVFTGSLSQPLVNETDLQIQYTRKDIGTEGAEALGVHENVLIAGWTENANYTVSATPADFTIKTATDTTAILKATGGEFPYDKAAHGASASVSGSEGWTMEYRAEGSTQWSKTLPTVTTVSEGTKTVGVRATKYGYASLPEQPVTIRITPISAAIAVNSLTKTYDGTLNVPEGMTLSGTITGVLPEEDLNVTYQISELTSVLPGTYAGAIEASYDTTNQNYTVTVTKGALTIENAVVEGAALQLTGGSKTYDGTAYSVEAATLVNVPEAGQYTITYSTDTGDNNAKTWKKERPSVTNVKEGEVSVWAKAERTGYEPIYSPEARISITPKEVTIQPNDADKFFDEKDPIFDGVKPELVAEGDLGKITYSRTNEEEAVGSYKDVIVGKYTNTENKNYKVTKEKADFTIKTATIPGANVTAAGGQWEYDGTAHFAEARVSGASGYTLYYSTDGGNTWKTTPPSVTNVKKANGLDDDVQDVNVKAERTGYVTLTTAEPVRIQITAKAITLQADAAWKYFDAKEPDFTGTTAKAADLVKDTDLGTVTYGRTNSDEGVGTYANVIQARYTENTNYNVTPRNADFEIKTAPIPKGAELTAEDVSETYDGKAHETNASLSKTATEAGYTIWYKDGNNAWTTTPPSIVNVADGPREIQIEARKDGYETIYPKNQEDGKATIAITAKDITYVVTDAEKVFTQEDPAFTGEPEANGLVGEDTLDMVFERTNSHMNQVGFYEKVLTAKQNPTHTNQNYNVHVTPGNFTITSAEDAGATLEAESGYWEYNGASHAATGKVSGTEDADAYTIYYKEAGGEWKTTAPAVTEVKDGEKTVAIEARREGYETLKATVTIQVYARTIAITAKDAAKKYGEAEPEFKGTVEEGRLVDPGDLGKITFVRSNKAADAGSYQEAIEPKFTENANYSPQITNGTFRIDPREVIVTAGNATKEYDGTALTSDVYKVTGDQFIGTQGFASVTVSGSQTIPGTAPNVMKEYKLNKETKAQNYTVTGIDGTLEVTDRTIAFPVNVTADSKTEVYNGDNKRITTYQVGGLLEGHQLSGLTVLASGSAVDVYPATISGVAVITDAKGNDVTTQYSVAQIEGALTIVGQVFYDNNGGSGVTADLRRYGKGATIAVAGSENVERAGAVFLGWSTRKTELVTSQAAEAQARQNITTQVFMGDKSFTLYAVWAIDENGPEGKEDKIPDYLEYKVSYDGNGGTGVVEDGNLYPADYEYTVRGNGYVNPGYAYDGWNTSANGSGTAYEPGSKLQLNGNTTLFAQWEADVIGEGEDPDQGDGIPDKYQVMVGFAAVNGTVSFERTVVTLRDENGKPAVKGTGTLNRVAAATAGEGYVQDSLSWAPSVPSVGAKIRAAVTFTATFGTAPVTPPTPPTPEGPPTPDNATPPTPEVTPATILATITEPLTALAQTVGEALNANVEELVAVDEEGVPLANRASTNHKCCILHLLLMLLALFVEISYTRSMKKRQQRIFEVREELAKAELELEEQKEKEVIA